MLTEQEYAHLADTTFRRILDAFEDVDTDLADVESAGDVITIAFGNGKRAVVNTQRPVRQIWLAGGARAWHFAWDAASARWLDDRGTGAELFATIAEVARETGGVALRFG